MSLTEGDGLEDEQVKCSVKKGGLVWGHGLS
jgi:hypothetical protein